MNTTIRTMAAAALFAVAGACLAANTPPAPVHLPPGIAWQQGDVDAAFAQAKRTNKPLLLYWGAVWCPSCNQVKATIFSQQAFKDRSSFFVPVYLDGDNESAQKLGERFKVRGYPTMILFRPDGTEITRLPGEVDLERYMQALSLGMNAAHPVRQTLANALKDGAKLTPDEWRMLADYSWDTDGDLPVPNERVAQTLQTLAQRAKADHANGEALRLELKAVVAAAGSSGAGAQQGEIDKAAGLAALQDVLRDAAQSRSNFDVLVTAPADLVGYLAGRDAAARARLAGAYDAALVRLNGDRSLSPIDRLAALDGRVALARLDTPKGPLAKPLLDTVRTQVAAADKATTNVYERAAVISTAADTLTDAGLLDASDALLKAELPRSATPYYFMSGLAANAKARGDKTAALDWYEKAYNAASGPATRLRWGAKYFTNAVELAPDDTARIQGIANSLLTQVAQTRNAFYGANRRALTTVVAQLVRWNKGGAHESTVKAVVRQFEGVCGKLPAGDPQAGTCGSLIQPAKA
ncbi:thioredoxin family protein [Burkholderia sp. FERM BP-3421]|jgi:thioredoxin-like negative regulator of GroEL|uniref:thioredoxin family protein n=1 Tax=Burkholderia sp. FERM BP-3421 TaxID=1494466 RepID=UPI0023614935|nr:thioredoxin family protein [Burkholderia sp. FERM BP-3421]WDD91117.1 thioredoxin family protein [Burkholderia sp. FERM BP-3421]